MNATLVKLQLWVKAFLPAVLWAGVIFVFSSQQSLPGFEVGVLDFLLKKFAHMFVYGVFYLLIARGVEMTLPAKTSPLVKAFLPLVIVFLYALSDEFHQSLVPNRYPTLRDIGYDLLGALIAWLRKHHYL